MRKVKLSASDIAYLKQSPWLSSGLHRELQELNIQDYVIEVTEELAEESRSIFTDHLAVVGFDANYQLTPEGRRLEDLIDKFYG